MLPRRLSHRIAARALIACSLALTCAAAAEAAGRGGRPAKRVETVAAPKTDRDCMARAMYFESRRTDGDGMLAVGTVVANRLAVGGRYGDSVCDVVGKAAQFAPGVLRRAMVEAKPRDLAYRMADAVLAGGRHPAAGGALYFHTADVPFRHDDKRYVLVSGGNAFYAWNREGGRARVRANLISLARATAAAPAARDAAAPVVAGDATIRLASLEAPAGGAVGPSAAAPNGAAPEATTALPAAAILAYAAPVAPPVAGSALAAVAALEPKRPRVITPAAPVQAAAGPVWPIRSGASAGSRAWSAGAIANAAVEKAWDLFEAVSR